ncbi:MAG: protein-disulfide reductase DsbD domain-containing protein [Rhodospirillales bacterium]
MRLVAASVLAVLGWHGAAMGASANLDDLVRARLVAENATVKPGETAWVALHLTMKRGWHTYWRNPGDSGQKTEVAWTLPKGFTAGAIHWPVPQTFEAGIGLSYGYAGEAALLVPVQVPAGAAPGAMELKAHANWLVCEAICVPGEARLTLALNVAPVSALDVSAKPLFGRARAALPGELKAMASARATENGIALDLPAEALKGIAQPQAVFMPFDDTLIDHAAPQSLKGAVLSLKRGPVQAKPPAETGGLLVVEDAKSGVKRAYNLAVRIRPE